MPGRGALGAGVVTALYLAVRVGVLLHAPRTGDQYTLGLATCRCAGSNTSCIRSMPSVFETFNTLARGVTTGARPHGRRGARCWWCCGAAARRLAAVFLIAGFAALGPVLLLGASCNHYA